MRRTFVLWLLAIGLGLVLAAPTAALAAAKIGDPVSPVLTVTTLDGKEAKVADLIKGKPAVLVFFNTVCKNCVGELRDVNKMYRKDEAKVTVLAVGVDMGGAKVLERFQGQQQFGFPIVADPDFSVGAEFGFGATPATVLIDGEGKLVEVLTGYSPDARSKVEAFINKK